MRRREWVDRRVSSARHDQRQGREILIVGTQLAAILSGDSEIAEPDPSRG